MSTCNGDHAEAERREPDRYRAGATFGASSSSLVFEGETDVELARRSLVGSFELRPSNRLSIQLIAGGVLGGLVETPRARYALGAGWLAAVSAGWRVLGGEGGDPFVLFGATVGASGAGTERYGTVEESATLHAIDARFAITAGKVFWQTLGPYVSVRAFGGPVLWSIEGTSVQGTDRYHFQLAAGLAVVAPAGLDVFAEIAPLGERAVAAGAGWSF